MISASCWPPNNGFFSGARVITDPLTGQPFPGNIIPAGRLSPTGVALLNAYPLPTPGFRQGSANAIISSENPDDQRKDNIRLDYRSERQEPVHLPYRKYNWKAIDAFRGTFALARTQWDRPNTNQTASWTSTLSSKLINEFSYTYRSITSRSTCTGALTAISGHKCGINYPYIFPADKAIPDRIPTITIGTFTEIDGSPYPSSSRGPISTFNEAATLLRGPPYAKGGCTGRVFGRGRFRSDQREHRRELHEQPERPVRVQQFSSRRQQHRYGRRRMPRWDCSTVTRRSAAGP